VRDPQAHQVVQEMLDAYAGLSSFKDEGHLENPMGWAFDFKIFMRRPTGFMYEYISTSTWYHGHDYIWGEGERKIQRFLTTDSGAFYGNSFKARRAREHEFIDLRFPARESINLAASVMAGPTQSTSLRVPSMLYPNDISPDAGFSELEDLQLEAPEVDRGVMCDVVYSPSRSLRGWIDNKTHLLRKTVDSNHAWDEHPDQHVETVTYNPQPNAFVQDSDLVYQPPKKQ
jgi:hypothetical protein